MFQALMVSDELIRVAILWHEQWHEGLEEASRHGGFEPCLDLGLILPKQTNFRVSYQVDH